MAPPMSGMSRRFAQEVAAIALVLTACTVAPSEIPSGSATSAPSPSPDPTIALSSTPAPSASASPAAEPLSAVHTAALGQVTGNWLFYGVQIPRPERSRIEIQIVAVPVGGGAATTVIAFDAAAIPAPSPNGLARFDNTPHLRRQFSPDGKRMVFSIDGQLVVIDLVTRQAKPLGVKGLYPSWSRDGSQIAFVFEKPAPEIAPGYARPAIAVLPAAGGSPRELTVTPTRPSEGGSDWVGPLWRGSIEWSPDGSRILVEHVHIPPSGFCTSEGCFASAVTVEVASGRIGHTDIRDLSDAHWRVGSPELAVAIRPTCDQLQGEGFARIVGVDEGTGSERTLVDVADPCVMSEGAPVGSRVQLRDPRWNPALADELLYVLERGTAGAAANDFEARVVNVATGKDTRIPISAYEATWTWDGSAVAYLAKSPGSSFGSAVRVWKRDGSGETELRRATGAEAFFSIASVSY